MATDPITDGIRKGLFLRRRPAGLVARDHTYVEGAVWLARTRMYMQFKETFERTKKGITWVKEPRQGVDLVLRPCAQRRCGNPCCACDTTSPLRVFHRPDRPVFVRYGHFKEQLFAAGFSRHEVESKVAKACAWACRKQGMQEKVTSFHFLTDEELEALSKDAHARLRTAPTAYLLLRQSAAAPTAAAPTAAAGVAPPAPPPPPQAKRVATPSGTVPPPRKRARCCHLCPLKTTW